MFVFYFPEFSRFKEKLNLRAYIIVEIVSRINARKSIVQNNAFLLSFFDKRCVISNHRGK